MQSSESSITFYGGVGDATGSNFLFAIGSDTGVPERVLVDCGLMQGAPDASEKNARPFAYEPSSIDVLLITHSHADHIGRVPKLVKEGFRGPIYSTPETKMIAELMFDDMLNIMAHDEEKKGIAPMYDAKNVADALLQWKELPYHTPLALKNGVTITPKDAGHILGSCFYEFARNGRTVVFSGDLGNTPSILVRDTEPLLRVNYLLVESVYGDRNHENRDERREKLRAAVLAAIERKSALIIPAFSIERSQVILYELNNLVEEGKVPSVPVFLDSPLAIKVTEVYRKMKKDFKPGVQEEIAGGDDIFKFPRLQLTATHQESERIDLVQSPKIIIAGGGMSEGGRVVSHEERYLPDPRNLVLLVGYQAVGTMGRALQDGAHTVTIRGKQIPVRAEIRLISGYSSHKDSDHLVEWVASSAETLKEVFVVMGEPKSSMFLAQRLRDELGVNAVFPEVGSTHQIEF